MNQNYYCEHCGLILEADEIEIEDGIFIHISCEIEYYKNSKP